MSVNDMVSVPQIIATTENPTIVLAKSLRDNLGLSPLPISPALPAEQYHNKQGKPLFTGKNPSYLDSNGKPHLIRHKDYQDRLPTDAEIEQWWANPETGIGYLHTSIAPNLKTLDLDRKNFASDTDCGNALAQILAAVPNALVDQTQSGGFHVCLSIDASFTNYGIGDVDHAGELLGVGRFVAIAPTTGYSRVQDGTFASTTSEALGIRSTKKKGKSMAAAPALAPQPEASFGSIPLEMLGTPQSQEILAGANPQGDRSASLTAAIQEWMGWENWCQANGVAYRGTTEELAIAAGHALDIDEDRVRRILGSVDTATCAPAAQHRGGDESCWKRVATLDRRYRNKAFPSVGSKPSPVRQLLLTPGFKEIMANDGTDCPIILVQGSTDIEFLGRNQPAIGLQSPSDGYTSEGCIYRLHPGIEEYADAGRTFVIALGAYGPGEGDLERQAIVAQYRMGQLLADAGCDVVILRWSHKRGRTLADLAKSIEQVEAAQRYQDGGQPLAEIVEDILGDMMFGEKSLPFESWKKTVEQDVLSQPTRRVPTPAKPVDVGAAQQEAAGFAGICMARLDPYAMFSPMLAEPLLQCARSVNVGIEGFIAPLLSTTASLIGNQVTISPKPDWVVGPTLWTAVVAKSGQGKSPPQRVILGPLKQLHAQAKEDYEYEQTEYKAEIKAWEAATKRGEDLPEPQQPDRRQYYLSDSTLEALLEAHCRKVNGRGILYSKYELSGFVLGMDQYKGSKGNDRQTWLELADGDAINRLTKGQYLDRRDSNICVTGGITPVVLDQLADNMDADGLWARFLWFTLPFLPREWHESTVNLDGLLLGLYSRLERLGENRLTLSPEAKARFIAKWTEWGNAAASAAPGIDNAYSKSPQKALAIALNLHCIQWGLGQDESLPPVVEDWAMAAAIHLCEYSLNQVCKRSGDNAVDLTPQQLRLIDMSQTVAGISDGWIKAREIAAKVRAPDGKRLDTQGAKELILSLINIGIGETREGLRGAIEWRYGTGTSAEIAPTGMNVDKSAVNTPVNEPVNIAQPAQGQGSGSNVDMLTKSQGEEKSRGQNSPEGNRENLSTCQHNSHNLDTVGKTNVDSIADNNVDNPFLSTQGENTTVTLIPPNPPTQPGQRCIYVGPDPTLEGMVFTFKGFMGVGCEAIAEGQVRTQYLDNPNHLRLL